MNLLTDNAPLLLSIGIALATGMIVVFGGSLFNTYWNRYAEKLSVEKQLQEQMASDYEDPRKNKSTLWFKWNKYWEKRLINSGVNFMAANRENAGRMVIYMDLAAVAIFAVIFRGSLLASIIIVITADIIMSFVLGFMADKRLEKLTRQLPAFVSALKSADARSKDASTTLQMAIATTPDELHNELKPVEEQLQAGGQLKPVLTGFYDQTSIEDLRFTMGCIMLIADTGVDWSKQLDIIQDIIESRIETAQALQQAISKIMPTIWVSTIFIPLIFLFTWFMQPIARGFWFHSLLSWILFIIIIALYVLGIWMAKHQIDLIKKL